MSKWLHHHHDIPSRAATAAAAARKPGLLRRLQPGACLARRPASGAAPRELGDLLPLGARRGLCHDAARRQEGAVAA